MTLPGVTCAPLADLPTGAYQLVLTLKQDDQVLSGNTYAVTVLD
jgi:hypothetical protein